MTKKNKGTWNKKDIVEWKWRISVDVARYQSHRAPPNLLSGAACYSATLINLESETTFSAARFSFLRHWLTASQPADRERRLMRVTLGKLALCQWTVDWWHREWHYFLHNLLFFFFWQKEDRDSSVFVSQIHEGLCRRPVGRAAALIRLSTISMDDHELWSLS